MGTAIKYAKAIISLAKSKNDNELVSEFISWSSNIKDRLPRYFPNSLKNDLASIK